MYEYHVIRFHPNDKTMCKLGIFETDLEILLKDFQVNGGWEFVSFTNNPNPEDKAVLCVFRKDNLLNESENESVKNLKDIPVYFFNSKDDKQIGYDIKLSFVEIELIKINKKVEYNNNYYDVTDITFNIRDKSFVIYID